MKKNSLTKIITVFGATALMVGALAGCGKTTEDNKVSEAIESVIEEEPIAKADPDAFDAVAFVDKSGRVDYKQYEDPNGWSVTYNAAKMSVTQQNNMVFFVYTGESAGTNMITVTYEPSVSAKDAVDEMVKSWGSDNATQNESIFPGTEDVTGYWAMLPPAAEGSGYYESVIARDYMEGSLIFETTGHNCGDDALDMAVSDELALIIDSITF